MAVGRNALWKLLEVGATAASGIGQFVLFARLLPVEAYGVLTSALAVAAVFQVSADLGMATSTNVHVARARARGEDEQVGSLVRHTLVAVAAISGSFSLLALLFAEQLAALQRSPDEIATYQIVSSLIFVLCSHNLICQILSGMERFKTLSIYNISFKSLQLAVIALALWAGAGPTGIVATLVGTGLLAIVGGLWLTLRFSPLEGAFAWDRSVLAPVARYGLPILAGNVSFYLYTRVDAVMLGAYRGPEEVGLFGFAERVVGIPLMALWAYTSVIGPRFAAHSARDEVAQLRRAWGKQMALAGGGAGVIAAGIWVCTPWVTATFFPSYQDAIPLVQVLGLVLLARAIGGVSGALLVNAGQARPLAWSTGLGASLNVALNLALIPAMGVAGVIWATVGSHSCSCLATTILAHRATRPSPSERP